MTCRWQAASHPGAVRRMVDKRPMPADAAQRCAALDPDRSFIVQAPAGSGKTGLLTQRYLKLLSIAEHPEEIIAITFTRKAAAEMRNRILQALAQADREQPQDPYQRDTWRLAREALARDEAREWNLLDNPQRLRIRTIDSLCQSIARQMPLRSGFGDVPAIAEDPSPLYRAAARSVLSDLESESEVSTALSVLLGELDNNIEGLHGLIADMLARRDQWLRHIVVPNAREEVERALRSAVEAQLRKVADVFPPDLLDETVQLARYAADNLDPDHPIAACRNFAAAPPPTVDGLSCWAGLTELLLTRSGTWRKRADVSLGFPVGSGESARAKKALVRLLDALRGEDRLAEELQLLRMLPEPGYSDSDWALLQALFAVLKAASAHLRLVFQEHGRVDFCETALAAQEALGTELEPSELALRLDYQIRHLLVDEFQDTSQNQHELFRRLTAGWQPGDGRSLFLVGDPMQSIYGFREAEVGLFLDAWQGRLGDVALEPLQLTVNFRSNQGVVDWVNRQFPLVFPVRPDKTTGAVPYAPSTAFRPAAAGPAVNVHAGIGRNDRAEAARVIEIIRAASTADPSATTGILVRSKAHLEQLIPALRANGLRFQAVEIGALGHRPVVMDALSLTLALSHLADRVSWLALLHSPLAGLPLSDLHALAGEDTADSWRTVPDLLSDSAAVARLSVDGQARVAAFMAVVARALEDRGRRPLRDWIEGAWLALGGPAGLADDGSAEDVEVYFRLLQELEDSGQPLTPERLRSAVNELFAQPDPRADGRLQLMTIHKAKGLEFDTVILPGLGKPPRSDRRKLLYWFETTDEQASPELFFGPVRSVLGDDEPRTTAYIRKLEAEMSRLESGRLLYVAATRARKSLHLLGHATPKKDGALAVDRGSLLGQLWPAISEEWEAVADDTGVEPETQALTGRLERTATLTPPHRRLPAGWVCPPPPATVGTTPELVAADPDAVVFEWAGDTARAIGTVVHRWLQRLAGAAAGAMEAEGGTFETSVRRMLQREGVVRDELATALERVRRALERTLQDSRGQWILSAEHEQAGCEVPLTALIDGQVRRLVIDRTFIDESGTRWIIDYKTGIHQGGDATGFLDEEAERYRAQLTAYAAAFRALEDRPVRTALFYPLVPGGWREVAV